MMCKMIRYIKTEDAYQYTVAKNDTDVADYNYDMYTWKDFRYVTTKISN